MIYEKCQINSDEIDIYETDNMGFLELLYCATKEKESKEVHGY